MTQTLTATELVDTMIRHCSGRDLVASSEMTDMLLDLRSLITNDKQKEEVKCANNKTMMKKCKK